MASWDQLGGISWEGYPNAWEQAFEIISINFACTLASTFEPEFTYNLEASFQVSVSTNLSNSTIIEESLSYSLIKIYQESSSLTIEEEISLAVDSGFSFLGNTEIGLEIVFEASIQFVPSLGGTFIEESVFNQNLGTTLAPNVSSQFSMVFRMEPGLSTDGDAILSNSVIYSNTINFLPKTPNWVREQPLLPDTWSNEEEV